VAPGSPEAARGPSPAREGEETGAVQGGGALIQRDFLVLCSKLLGELQIKQFRQVVLQDFAWQS